VEDHACMLWEQGEELLASGEKRSALGAFIDAALADEQCGRHDRALVAWQSIARRFGVTGHLLERCARVSERLSRDPDTYLFWVAAAALYKTHGMPKEAHVATMHALILKEEERMPHPNGEWQAPKLAMDILTDDSSRQLVSELLW
jgi:hypothetical protein